MKEEKKFRTLMKDWNKEATNAGKVFCSACARQDYNLKKLADSWTKYAELEEIGTSQIRDRKTGVIPLNYWPKSDLGELNAHLRFYRPMFYR